MGTAETGKPFEIFLVEDNPGDVRLTIEALKEQKTSHNLRVAGDGQQAIDLLSSYGDEALPDLVFLDWNLPRKNGREVLEEMKGDRRLRHIPVVVLTTSDAERDIRQAYELHANCYIKKPVDLEEFMDVIAAIEKFWLTIVKLPRKH